MNTRLDWPGLMAAGLRELRLTPDDFWALTPAELALMLGHGAGPRPMDRAGFDALLQAFPDRPLKEHDDGRD